MKADHTSEALALKLTEPSGHRFLSYPYTTSLLLLSFLTTLAIYLSFSHNQIELGSWGCGMSWMHPNYILMDGPKGDMSGLEKKYSLWLYREGGLQDEATVSRWIFGTRTCRCVSRVTESIDSNHPSQKVNPFYSYPEMQDLPVKSVQSLHPPRTNITNSFIPNLRLPSQAGTHSISTPLTLTKNSPPFTEQHFLNNPTT